MPTNRELAELKEVMDRGQHALRLGDRSEARRMARRAVRIAPNEEAPWLLLAAASEPRPGLAYAARALEINPKSKIARKAIRYYARKIPPAERSEVAREVRLPEDLKFVLAPSTALSRRRWFSAKGLLPAVVMMAAFVIWFGSQPAVALEPQQASDPQAKASSTPTPTNTATPTPTYTATPTSTHTPLPTSTATKVGNLSWEYVEDPAMLAQEGEWIDVDISDQRVTAYRGAEIVRSFVVSTGTLRHPTVLGQFRIYVKLTSTTMSGPGYYLEGVPYTMYFYRGYGIHGTYWHSNFGTPMSHGCVNLTIEDSRWIFDFAQVGTLINIHP